MDFGVYVHFPWCRARCPYCDFAIAVAPLEDIPHVAYADRVLVELAARAPLFAGRTLRSIYFGGGTPALWDPTQIARLRETISATFGQTPEEITVEANPNDCTAEKLARLAGAGVNRLSIGTQGFTDGDLVLLGRDHSGAAAAAAVRAARAAGFDRVSLDLIYALPGRDLASWGRTLDAAIELAPDHLSVYQLTVEPGTPFGQQARDGRLTPAPDDDAAAQFELAHDRLEAAGYPHYEVSSYGRRAVHNSLYWSGGEYLGLGNGAHSFHRDGQRGTRWSGHRSVVKYMASSEPAETTTLDAAAVQNDLIWTAMRTRDGVPAAWVAARKGLARLHAAGLVEAAGDRIRPTPRGLLFADEIANLLLE